MGSPATLGSYTRPVAHTDSLYYLIYDRGLSQKQEIILYLLCGFR